MSQQPDSRAETLQHAFIVALLTGAAALVENFKEADWVKDHVPEVWVRAGAVVGVACVAFFVVLFIGRRLDRNRHLAQEILDRQPLQSAAGPLDGLWIDAVWNGENLVGGSIFSIKSSRADGIRLNGEFYEFRGGVLAKEPTGWFNGLGQQIDKFGFAYRYEGGEQGPVRPVDHNGTGYYHFHGKPGWQIQTFHGHFSISEPLQVRVLRGERRSDDPDIEIRTTQSHQWLVEFIDQFVTVTQAARPAETGVYAAPLAQSGARHP